MTRQNLRYGIFSVAIAAPILASFGCNHGGGGDAMAANASQPAPIIDARTKLMMDRRAAGAEFDAKQRAAAMARMKQAAK